MIATPTAVAERTLRTPDAPFMEASIGNVDEGFHLGRNHPSAFHQDRDRGRRQVREHVHLGDRDHVTAPDEEAQSHGDDDSAIVDGSPNEFVYHAITSMNVAVGRNLCGQSREADEVGAAAHNAVACLQSFDYLDIISARPLPCAPVFSRNSLRRAERRPRGGRRSSTSAEMGTETRSSALSFPQVRKQRLPDPQSSTILVRDFKNDRDAPRLGIHDASDPLDSARAFQGSRFDLEPICSSARFRFRSTSDSDSGTSATTQTRSISVM